MSRSSAADTSSSLQPSRSWLGRRCRLSVSGLVPQGAVCYVGIDCLGWPPANYPRQIATVKALDVNGNVATSYAGTVTFTNPFNGVTPGGLVDSTLTRGVGYVPVLIPSLPLTFVGEPYTSSCPGGNVVFTAVDTLDPVDLRLPEPRGRQPQLHPPRRVRRGRFRRVPDRVLQRAHRVDHDRHADHAAHPSQHPEHQPWWQRHGRRADDLGSLLRAGDQPRRRLHRRQYDLPPDHRSVRAMHDRHELLSLVRPRRSRPSPSTSTAPTSRSAGPITGPGTARARGPT